MKDFRKRCTDVYKALPVNRGLHASLAWLHRDMLDEIARLTEECGRDQRNAAASQAESAQLLDQMELLQKELGYYKTAGLASQNQPKMRNNSG